MRSMPSPVPSTAIFSGQPARSFSNAALGSSIATGLPMVWEKRMPPSTSIRSRSTLARPPRPKPSQRRDRCSLTSAGTTGTPAGIPSTMPTRAGPCDSPAVKYRRPMRAEVETARSRWPTPPASRGREETGKFEREAEEREAEAERLTLDDWRGRRLAGAAYDRASFLRERVE